jgi:hypothetical protein
MRGGGGRVAFLLPRRNATQYTARRCSQTSYIAEIIMDPFVRQVSREVRCLRGQAALQLQLFFQSVHGAILATNWRFDCVGHDVHDAALTYQSVDEQHSRINITGTARTY